MWKWFWRKGKSMVKEIRKIWYGKNNYFGIWRNFTWDFHNLDQLPNILATTLTFLVLHIRKTWNVATQIWDFSTQIKDCRPQLKTQTNSISSHILLRRLSHSWGNMLITPWLPQQISSFPPMLLEELSIKTIPTYLIFQSCFLGSQSIVQQQ